MPVTDSPHSSAARQEPWFRLAIVETLTGGILGLVTATILVVLSLKVFPGLADFDHDLGLAMRNFSEQFDIKSRNGIAPADGQPTFVFLDVDPGSDAPQSPGESSQAACQALERAQAACRPDAPPTGQQGAAQSRQLVCKTALTPLDCSTVRPLNRYLLAELIKALRQRNAQLIVLDVELDGAAEGFSPVESDALRQALLSGTEIAVPVLLVRSAEFDGYDEDRRMLVRPSASFRLAEVPAEAASQAASHRIISAVALPSPGQPVRRYPRCYLSVDREGAALPSLPWAAAGIIARKPTDVRSMCGSTDPARFAAPYINFRIPSMRAHADDTRQDDDFRTWGTYNRLMTRCLASNFWSPQSPCSLKETYDQKVVVIGASSRNRRDRHLTPIGDMAGAELVINAIQSFAAEPAAADKRTGAAIAKKAWVVTICLLPWLGFFCLRGYWRARFLPAQLSHEGHEQHAPPTGRRIAVGLATACAFTSTLIAVLSITIWSGMQSFSVLVGVLAIGIEQYVETITNLVLHPCEAFLKRLLRLPAGHGSHG